MKNIVVIGSGARDTAVAAHLGRQMNVMHFTKKVPKDALELCDAVILPLPATADGVHITNSETAIDEIFGFGDITYIGGRISDAFDKYRKKYTIIDYTLSEDFAIRNAVPTAEAAVSIAIENTPFTIQGSRCLITGYGRIAKVLARYLRALDADVTCCVRKVSQKAQAEADGFKTVNYGNLEGLSCNIIFNTVPAKVLTEKILLTTRANLIVDLASHPGGCDFEAAEKMGIKAIHALALPGKTAPLTAAKITADTIASLL